MFAFLNVMIRISSARRAIDGTDIQLVDSVTGVFDVWNVSWGLSFVEHGIHFFVYLEYVEVDSVRSNFALFLGALFSIQWGCGILAKPTLSCGKANGLTATSRIQLTEDIVHMLFHSAQLDH